MRNKNSVLSVILTAVMITTSAFVIMGTPTGVCAITPCNDAYVHQLSRYEGTTIISFGEYTNTQPVASRRAATTRFTFDSVEVSNNCDGLPVTEIIKTYAESMVALGFDCKHPCDHTYIFIKGKEYMKIVYSRIVHKIFIVYR